MSDSTLAPYTVRPAEPRDLDTLVRFNLALAGEVEHRGLDAATLRRGIEACLGERPPARYLVAEHTASGHLAGQLMTFTEWSDWRCASYLRVESVYVAPEHRRCGVYRALHAHVLRDAEADAAVCGVRICVHRDNTAARETYLALGMTPNGCEVLDLACAEPGAPLRGAPPRLRGAPR